MTSPYNLIKKEPTMTTTLESDTGFPMALKNIMRALDLEGDVVYKGYDYMLDGQEVWQVQAHIYKIKKDDPKTKGYHIFCATAHHSSFFDFCESVAWNVVDTLGIVLATRLRLTHAHL